MTKDAPYVFKFSTLDPLKVRPIGDRYLVEIVETEGDITAGGLLLPDRTEDQKGWAVGIVFSIGNGHRLEVPDPALVLPEGYKPDPKAKARLETIELELNREASRLTTENVAGVISNAESAALFKAFSERRREEANEIERTEMDRRMRSLGYEQPISGDACSVMRVASVVPMFFIPGEVIFIERWSGRQFQVHGRTFRFVNQVDCLGSSGVYVKPSLDGLSWVERDLEAERAG